MLHFLAHSKNLRGGLLFNGMPDPLKSQCFQSAFLPFRHSDFAADLGDPDFLHNAASL